MSIFSIDSLSLIDVEQLEIEQSHVFGLKDLLLSRSKLVLSRDQFDGILNPERELLKGQVIALAGILLLLQGRDVTGLVGHGTEIGGLHLFQQVLLYTLLLEAGVLGGEAGLIESSAVAAVGVDGDTEGQTDVFVEIVPVLVAAHIAGGRASGPFPHRWRS